MALTPTQIELIKKIQEGLQRGDIRKIADETDLSRVRVSQCLNIQADFFNEKVMEAAVRIISQRDENAAKLLQEITT